MRPRYRPNPDAVSAPRPAARHLPAVTASVALLLGVVLTQLPLMGIMGVESALMMGLVLPLLAGPLGALVVIRTRERGLAAHPSALLSAASRRAIALVGLPTLCLWLHGLLTQSCDPITGAVFVALGPGLGALLAAFAGVVTAALIPRARWALTIAAALPLISAALGVWEFYSSPSIFVFGAFVGYFPGTLYDRSVQVTNAYLTYRTGTVLALATLALVLHALYSPGLGRMHLAHAMRHKGAVVVAGLGLTGLILLHAYGPELGHRGSAAFIQETLGQRIDGELCTAYLPRETSPEDAHRLARDCDFRVAEAQRTLGVRLDGDDRGRRVSAYFYRSAAEKRRLMGADQTFIAKPWRDEVHLQLAGWPHPVLAHEVAHVVAGEAAQGPFRIGGSMGGWLPNAGLIEGMAVAVAFRSRDDMTPHQWARAMLELDHMPPLSAVMGSSFFNSSAAQSYTVAGSFLRWLADTRGWDVVRRAYHDGDVAAAAGAPLTRLEADWHEYLRTVPLPEGARELARMRFERPGVVHAICPHAIADLMRQLDADSAAGDVVRVKSTCREILAMDPANLRAHVALIGGLARAGELSAARELMNHLGDDLGAPTPYQVAAASTLADALVRQGHYDQARAIYEAQLAQPQADGSSRLLEVKVWALRRPAEVRDLIFDLFLGKDLRGSPTPVIVELADRLAHTDTSGLGPYLGARQLIGADRYDLAKPMLLDALARGLPTRRLTVEAERLAAIASFAVGEIPEARRRFTAIQNDSSRLLAARTEATDWLERAHFEFSTE